MRYPLYLFCFILLASSCRSKTPFLKEVKKLPHYPSASGIEFYNKQLYIIGDDATHLLALDSILNIRDSIQLYTSAEKRIPKDSKPDLEAITTIRYKDSNRLLLTGSGSLSPLRNTAWLIDPLTKQKTNYSLDTFFQRLKNQGLSELNIEGSCSFFNTIVFANRGHNAFPKNHLVFTPSGFWNNQTTAAINIIKIGSSEDSTNFQGVSGLTYARRSDKLILTVSTEATSSVYEDGAIGKSYLWIVDNISSKRRWKAINPNRVIDLEKADTRFKGQKIESVCIMKENRNYIHLALVADNDDGSSMLFKLIIEKE
jgi:hypothetical protein